MLITNFVVVVVVVFAALLCTLVPTTHGISIKYRRWCSPWKFCSLTPWNRWGPCDKTCGGGVRTRYRQMCSLPVIDFAQHVATCNRKLSDLIQYENCSQTCSSYGRWSNETNQCVCNDQSTAGSCCTIGKSLRRCREATTRLSFRSRSLVGMVVLVAMSGTLWNVRRTKSNTNVPVESRSRQARREEHGMRRRWCSTRKLFKGLPRDR